MRKIALATLACSAPVPATAWAGPAIATRYTEPSRWTNPRLTQEGCLERAEAVLRSTGFDEIERTQQSRYGIMREYTASIRCIIDKEIVLVVVSGPSRQIADRGAGALFQNFETAE